VYLAPVPVEDSSESAQMFLKVQLIQADLWVD